MHALTQKLQRSFDADPSWIPYPEDVDCLKHAEFGHCEEQDYRYTSEWRGWEADNLVDVPEEPSLATFLTTYLSYIVLIVIGHVRDFFGKRLRRQSYAHLMEQDVSFCPVSLAPWDLLFGRLSSFQSLTFCFLSFFLRVMPLSIQM